MPQFDPRRASVRLAPRLVVAVAGVAALGVGWKLNEAERQKPAAAVKPLNPEALAALQAQAFEQSATPPGFAKPVDVSVKVRSGETLEAAVRRTGVAAEEARQAVDALGKTFDTVNIKAGLAFDAAIAQAKLMWNNVTCWFPTVGPGGPVM